MSDKRKGSSIRDANDLKTVYRLRRDNRSTLNGHIWADDTCVDIVVTKDGVYKSINLSKKQFNILIDWYNRQQKFVRK